MARLWVTHDAIQLCPSRKWVERQIPEERWASLCIVCFINAVYSKTCGQASQRAPVERWGGPKNSCPRKCNVCWLKVIPVRCYLWEKSLVLHVLCNYMFWVLLTCLDLCAADKLSCIAQNQDKSWQRIGTVANWTFDSSKNILYTWGHKQQQQLSFGTVVTGAVHAAMSLVFPHNLLSGWQPPGRSVLAHGKQI